MSEQRLISWVSMKPELQERLERLVRGRVGSRPSAPFDATEAVGAEAEAWVSRTTMAAKRLIGSGTALREAPVDINDLAVRRPTVRGVSKETASAVMTSDLHGVNVRMRRKTAPAAEASRIAAVLERRSLSQLDFADRLGIDLRTLQNWKQGRNRRDPAAMTLIRWFDHEPGALLAIACEATE